jgi:uncharacterized protein YbaR (Trm112 family)
MRNVVERPRPELSHEFSTIIDCPVCGGTALLIVLERERARVETRVFFCGGCLNRTYLKVAV